MIERLRNIHNAARKIHSEASDKKIKDEAAQILQATELALAEEEDTEEFIEKVIADFMPRIRRLIDRKGEKK
jgi:RNA polymerase-interacting CarD/CdnL/TRCF family regulator